MKKWAFVSDFDGTISKKDFYRTVIERYFPKGYEVYNDWKEGKLKDIDFLATVFSSINQDEEALIKMIHSIEIDDGVPSFIRSVQESGGDFFILSAGTDYYIDHLLKKYRIENVEVYANKGYFKNNNIYMNIDKEDGYYSEQYGIDKSKIIQKLKEEYETVYFIGDSEPDSHPAVHADVTFAKNGLQDLLREREVSFKPVEAFEEVEQYLKEEDVLK